MEKFDNILSLLHQNQENDELKKDSSLVVLGIIFSCFPSKHIGNSNNACLSVINDLAKSLNQPDIKRKDFDFLHYSYLPIGKPDRKVSNEGIGLF